MSSLTCDSKNNLSIQKVLTFCFTIHIFFRLFANCLTYLISHHLAMGKNLWKSFGADKSLNRTIHLSKDLEKKLKSHKMEGSHTLSKYICQCWKSLCFNKCSEHEKWLDSKASMQVWFYCTCQCCHSEFHLYDPYVLLRHLLSMSVCKNTI